MQGLQSHTLVDPNVYLGFNLDHMSSYPKHWCSGPGSKISKMPASSCIGYPVIARITESCHYAAKFVATGGTAGCRYDNLLCHRWRQNLHHGNFRVHSCRLLQNSLTFPWHLPDSIHISLTKCNKKKCKWQVLKSISQNKRPPSQKVMMSTKQSEVHNETIWKSTHLRKILSLNLANWSILDMRGD